MKHFVLKNKRYAFILLDVGFVFLSYFIAVLLLQDGELPGDRIVAFQNTLFLSCVLYISFFLFFHVYRSLLTYAGAKEYGLIILAVNLELILVIIAGQYDLFPVLSAPYLILGSILMILFAVGSRMLLGILNAGKSRVFGRKTLKAEGDQKRKKTLIIGAGRAASIVTREYQFNSNYQYDIVGIIDDDIGKHHSIMNNLKILGGREKIKEVCEQYGVEEILIAIPSISGNNKKELVDMCRETGCEIKLLPPIGELTLARSMKANFRSLHIEDLLARDSIILNIKQISSYVENKVILVSGGGGSIGSELCRQIAKFRPLKLIILDMYENNTYEIQTELRQTYPDLQVHAIIANIQEKRRIDLIFGQYKPEVLFHAAAYKHVPLMEESPKEAVLNNVFGTKNLMQCAIKHNTKKVIQISTDKAVNPTNVMGTTKRICEMLVQGLNGQSATEFVAVRFGNVLGSNGSVIPLFQKQIEQGGPLTLTHKDITRYFMTIPEAAQLVMQAAAYAKGGEIFVLDMGEPVKIYDLAVNLIRLSGLEPEKDIKIQITGLRPGEKLYEELSKGEEEFGKVHDKIFVAKPLAIDYAALLKQLDDLEQALEDLDDTELKERLREIIPEYTIDNKKHQRNSIDC